MYEVEYNYNINLLFSPTRQHKKRTCIYQCSHSRTYVRNSRIEHWIHVQILILCTTCTWPARKEKMLKSRNSGPNIILRKLPPIIQAGIPFCLIWISHTYIWLNDSTITSEGSEILITPSRKHVYVTKSTEDNRVSLGTCSLSHSLASGSSKYQLQSKNKTLLRALAGHLQATRGDSHLRLKERHLI